MLKKRGGGGDDDNSTLLDAIAEIDEEGKTLLDKEKLLQRNYKSFQSFLVDVNFQEDDEEEDGDMDSRHDNDVIMEEVDGKGESDYDDLAALSMDETSPLETNTAAAAGVT